MELRIDTISLDQLLSLIESIIGILSIPPTSRLDQDTVTRLKLIINPNNRDKISNIFTTLKEGEIAGQDKIVYTTHTSYDRLLCQAIGSYLGYHLTDATTERIVKHVDCHQYDEVNPGQYEAYCSCDRMPTSITNRGIDHTEYDSDHDEDFDNHFYPIVKTTVIGITFSKTR